MYLLIVIVISNYIFNFTYGMVLSIAVSIRFDKNLHVHKMHKVQQRCINIIQFVVDIQTCIVWFPKYSMVS